MREIRTTETISRQISGIGQQAVRYTETLKAFGQTNLRIKIKSDHVASQSYAAIEVWDQNSKSWNEMHTIYGESVIAQVGYQKSLADDVFDDDRAELLRVVAEMLSIG